MVLRSYSTTLVTGLLGTSLTLGPLCFWNGLVHSELILNVPIPPIPLTSPFEVGHGSDYTLTETGTLWSTVSDNGNTVLGSYSHTISGSDAYTMTETGTNTGSSYTEVVTGADGYTLSEFGNPGTNTFSRTTIGSGSYTLTDSGPGATLANVPSGAITYSMTETADVTGAVFSQSHTGQTRYDLLEKFNDVSNTGGGNTPGNMNFFSFGQPFVDPGPGPEDRQPDETIEQWRTRRINVATSMLPAAIQFNMLIGYNAEDAQRNANLWLENEIRDVNRAAIAMIIREQSSLPRGPTVYNPESPAFDFRREYLPRWTDFIRGGSISHQGLRPTGFSIRLRLWGVYDPASPEIPGRPLP